MNVGCPSTSVTIEHDSETHGLLTLSDEWRACVVENLMRGAARGSVVDQLVAGGVGLSLATSEVDAILKSPTFDACARYRDTSIRYAMVLGLQSELRPNNVAEIDGSPSPDRFYNDFYQNNRPFVARRFAAHWPAMSGWTPSRLRERFGNVEIEVEVERGKELRGSARSYVSMPIAELVDKVLAAGRSNEFYAVANNKNRRRPELAELHDDIAVDPGIVDPTRSQSATSIWIGPAGTLTPLHHDATNVLFVQIVGRKRVRLIAPTDIEAIDSLCGFYADPALTPGLESSYELHLDPGDAVLIPVGWLHEVEALDVSVSCSLLGFHRRNSFPSYRPGRTQ